MPVSRSISFTQNISGRTRTSDDNAATDIIFIHYNFDGHVQRGNSVIEVFLHKSGQAEFLESIVGIGNQLSDKNIPEVTVSGPTGKEKKQDSIPV